LLHPTFPHSLPPTQNQITAKNRHGPRPVLPTGQFLLKGQVPGSTGVGSGAWAPPEGAGGRWLAGCCSLGVLEGVIGAGTGVEGSGSGTAARAGVWESRGVQKGVIGAGTGVEGTGSGTAARTGAAAGAGSCVGAGPTVDQCGTGRARIPGAPLGHGTWELGGAHQYADLGSTGRDPRAGGAYHTVGSPPGPGIGGGLGEVLGEEGAATGGRLGFDGGGWIPSL
jgi:hypothetical protein